MEKCANCERVIGNLETPFLFKGQTVCEQCHRLLAGSAASHEIVGDDFGATPPSAEAFAAVKSTWTPNSPKLTPTRTGGRCGDGGWRKQVAILGWVGVALWFGPFVIFGLIALLTGRPEVFEQAGGCLQLSWLGAILAIGCGVASFVGKK